MSGYHMAVVAGVVFFTVGALLALIPALTTGFPIKKWSAAAALAAAAFYLLLSGAEVATQRSFFMTAVVLIAVMVDRRAVTFRTLAVAAMSDNTPQAPCDLSSKGGLLLLRVSSRS
jgi:competence protein ComEC